MRNLSFETLRIGCIFGIITMHSFGLLMNMLLIYLIGRYIKLYANHIKNTKRLFCSACGITLVSFALNLLITFAKGTPGILALFGRDNSVTIILGSIFFFLSFRNLTFYSKSINTVSGMVLSVYLFDEPVRMVLNRFLIDLPQFRDTWYLFILLVAYVLVVMISCLFVEVIRRKLFSSLEDRTADLIIKIFCCGKRFAVKWGHCAVRFYES